MRRFFSQITTCDNNNNNNNNKNSFTVLGGGNHNRKSNIIDKNDNTSVTLLHLCYEGPIRQQDDTTATTNNHNSNKNKNKNNGKATKKPGGWLRNNNEARFSHHIESVSKETKCNYYNIEQLVQDHLVPILVPSSSSAAAALTTTTTTTTSPTGTTIRHENTFQFYVVRYDESIRATKTFDTTTMQWMDCTTTIPFPDICRSDMNEKTIYSRCQSNRCFVLRGTIPYEYKNNIYHQLLDVYLPHPYFPLVAPVVFVRKSTLLSSLKSTTGNNKDDENVVVEEEFRTNHPPVHPITGQIFCQYLSDWDGHSSKLSILLQQLSDITFKNQPPVSAKRRRLPSHHRKLQQLQQQQHQAIGNLRPPRRKANINNTNHLINQEGDDDDQDDQEEDYDEEEEDEGIPAPPTIIKIRHKKSGGDNCNSTVSLLSIPSAVKHHEVEADRKETFKIINPPLQKKGGVQSTPLSSILNRYPLTTPITEDNENDDYDIAIQQSRSPPPTPRMTMMTPTNHKSLTKNNAANPNNRNFQVPSSSSPPQSPYRLNCDENYKLSLRMYINTKVRNECYEQVRRTLTLYKQALGELKQLQRTEEEINERFLLYRTEKQRLQQLHDVIVQKQIQQFLRTIPFPSTVDNKSLSLSSTSSSTLVRNNYDENQYNHDRQQQRSYHHAVQKQQQQQQQQVQHYQHYDQQERQQTRERSRSLPEEEVISTENTTNEFDIDVGIPRCYTIDNRIITVHTNEGGIFMEHAPSLSLLSLHNTELIVMELHAEDSALQDTRSLFDNAFVLGKINLEMHGRYIELINQKQSDLKVKLLHLVQIQRNRLAEL